MDLSGFDVLVQSITALLGGGAGYGAAKVEISWLKSSRKELRDTIIELYKAIDAFDKRIDAIELKVGIMHATKDMTMRIKRHD